MLGLLQMASAPFLEGPLVAVAEVDLPVPLALCSMLE